MGLKEFFRLTSFKIIFSTLSFILLDFIVYKLSYVTIIAMCACQKGAICSCPPPVSYLDRKIFISLSVAAVIISYLLSCIIEAVYRKLKK